MDQCLALADWNGFPARAQGERAARQAARPGRHALHRARRRVQRAHGNPVRSRRHGDHHRRHPFARAGPRHRVRAACRRMARRAVRGDQLYPGRHRESRVRPRHVRGAKLAGRRQRIARRRRRGHRPRQGNGRRADGGGALRHRIRRRHLHGRGHRQKHADRRSRPGLLCSGRAGDEAWSRPRRRRHLVGRAGRRAQLPEWLPGVRSRGRSGNRRGAHRSLSPRSTISAW